MIRSDLIPKPPADHERSRRLRALVASCAFHGVAIGLLVALAFIYREHMPPRSGSAPATVSITLSTLVIVSPPPVPVKPAPTPPVPTVVATPPTPPPPPEAPPPPPEASVPVLAVQPPKPGPVKPAAISAVTHPATAHPVAATPKSHTQPAPSSFASSYAPGADAFPHPPYPTEASDRRQTGTVILNVQFDAQGGVAQAEIEKSSGSSILDSSTRSFIRARWHNPAYAGQTVSVPVQYTLENL